MPQLYHHDGTPRKLKNGDIGCFRGTSCWFVHPDSPLWNNLPPVRAPHSEVIKLEPSRSDPPRRDSRSIPSPPRRRHTPEFHYPQSDTASRASLSRHRSPSWTRDVPRPRRRSNSPAFSAASSSHHEREVFRMSNPRPRPEDPRREQPPARKSGDTQSQKASTSSATRIPTTSTPSQNASGLRNPVNAPLHHPAPLPVAPAILTNGAKQPSVPSTGSNKPELTLQEKRELWTERIKSFQLSI